MAEREKWAKVWLHFMKKDDNSTGCNACKMIISSKRWKHQQHAEASIDATYT